MAGDYIPHSDSALTEWAKSFVNYLEAHAADLGIVPEMVELLKDQHEAFGSAYLENHRAQAAARVACTTKDLKRGEFLRTARSVAQLVQAGMNTTDADREALGLVMPGNREPVDLATAEDTPQPLIDISSRLAHVIRVRNRTSSCVQRARPKGVLGFEVWRKIGDAPNGFRDMELVEVVTRTPFVLEYPDDHAGRTVHYAFRWMNNKGEKGAWGPTVSATIAA